MTQIAFTELEVETAGYSAAPFTHQLLKWIGNKQKFAHEIISYFPTSFRTYHEPFLGSGAVLGTLAPCQANASDCFVPLMEIWRTLCQSPNTLDTWYRERWRIYMEGGGKAGYEQILASYNASPNGADLLFLCRACYGGVVRFRKADGYMSTPCGVHKPMPPHAFAARAQEWARRTAHTVFAVMDFEEARIESNHAAKAMRIPAWRKNTVVQISL